MSIYTTGLRLFSSLLHFSTIATPVVLLRLQITLLNSAECCYADEKKVNFAPPNFSLSIDYLILSVVKFPFPKFVADLNDDDLITFPLPFSIC